MPAAKPAGKNVVAGISSEAVKAATGRTWTEWFRLLDKAGAKSLPHAQIVRLLAPYKKVGDWWRQMLTVGYEQDRGLRKAGQTSRGWQVSRSRTLDAPIAKVFAAWQSPARRGRWLTEGALDVSSSTKHKYLRGAWDDGASRIEVYFTAKTPGRTQVAIQHNKLPDQRSVERMRAFWGRQLDNLAAMLTTTRAAGAKG